MVPQMLIGRQDDGSCKSPFLGTGVITDCFQIFGNVAARIDRLYITERQGASAVAHFLRSIGGMFSCPGYFLVLMSISKSRMFGTSVKWSWWPHSIARPGIPTSTLSQTELYCLANKLAFSTESETISPVSTKSGIRVFFPLIFRKVFQKSDWLLARIK